MTQFNARVASAAGLAMIFAASQAYASGFAVREDSAEGVATVFSGAASAADSPSTVYDNPAGMTQLHGTQIEAGAVTVFPTINFHGSATHAGAPVAGNNGNNGGRAGMAPSAYGILDLSDQWRLGVAINSPFGLQVKNNAGWYGRYLGVDSAVLSTNVNPSVAYKLNDKISLGGGVSAQWLDTTLSQAINQSGVGAGDAMARYKGDDWGFGYNFGLLYQPLNGTKVGLTYRSKVSHKTTGDLAFLNVSPLLAGTFKSGAASLDASLPASTTLGVTQAISPALNVSLGVQYTQWSTLQQLYVVSSAAPATTAPTRLGFSDTWFTSLGASYQWNEAWTLRGGVGWDQSPVDNFYRTVNLPDQDRYMVGIGFGYKISDALTLDAAYSHYFASHASMNSSINASDNNPISGATVIHGTYQLSLDYVAASLKYKF
jgi:long-chain fatty acid transport protein